MTRLDDIRTRLDAFYRYEGIGELYNHAPEDLRLLLNIAEAARALFGRDLDDPPNNCIFDPHGAIEEISALASALAALEAAEGSP